MGTSIDLIKNQEWKARVEAWQASGQSISRWCQDRNIADSTFAYWKKKFSKKAFPCPSLFTELPEEEPAALQLEYEGAKFFLSKNFDEDVFASCLKIFRRISC